ncbi:hypothetical protein L211DRAFT_865137 [Terfezia boudieri ATCC MYA-4762]|uniref:Ribosomal protein S36, mitochondrial n=1 Tax=Terfezia boudieri ATCC MYA-4762 TaxID=1051890 RepID=A0A3N4M094_9PEZI|nr:hypothetical protein L211DRAFT_865137 [Terfezia boudieri ATCC MYA-4762]
MIASRVLRARTPLIQFLGKRSIPGKERILSVCICKFKLILFYPESIDHSPRLHPQDPHPSLPTSFAEYRVRASQHGPLTGYRSASSTATRPSIQPKEGEHFDRNELPKRFWRLRISKAEMQAIEDGAAIIA